jgi:hypothetical protein
MSEREILVKKIINEFAILETKIDKYNKLNLTDINIFSEDFFAKILNLIFRYNLKPFKKINYPSIDLGDKENGIAIQITSKKKKSKIQKTLDGFQIQKLSSEFLKLKILILNQKQKEYKNLKIAKEINFNPNTDIIDFNDLIKEINTLPNQKIKRILNIFKTEFYEKENNSIISLRKIKRNLNLRMKIEDDLVTRLSYQEAKVATYEPYIKFLYYDVIIRSPEDIHFPNSNDSPETGCTSWFKVGIYDFYEKGLEFIQYGGTRILIDKEGYWDIVRSFDDPRKEKYQIENAMVYLRVPYDYIVKYDLNVDPVYGLPTFYIIYNNKNCPYEEIVYGTFGDAKKKEKRSLFDNHKMRNLK